MELIETLEAVGATLVKDAAGSVTEVRFGKSVPPDALAALPDLTGLRSVVLAGSDADDAAVAAVAKVPGLRNLDLRDCKVTNAGLAPLAGMHGLAALRLSGKSGACTVDDAGMEHVAKIPTLRTLMLDFLWVSEQGLETLAPLEDLEELTRSATAPTDGDGPDVMRAKWRRSRSSATSSRASRTGAAG